MSDSEVATQPQLPRRRNRVQKMMDNINDMSDKEREAILDHLVDQNIDEEANAKALAELVDPLDYVEGAYERLVNWGKPVGLESGYHDIDHMTLGFAPGELTIVAGETSQGKTMLCCNIAARMAMAGHKVVFVTLEMTKEELLSRLWKIVDKNLDCDDKVDKLCANTRFQKLERMDWKTIPYIVEQAKRWGAEIIFIDHLHYFAREMHDVANELGIITQEFKQAAIKNDIPVVLISHTRKVDKSRGKDHASIDDLRGSSYIAQDADIVLMVYQDKESDEPHLYVELAKNRNRLDYKIGSYVRHARNGVEILDVERNPNGSYPCDAYSINGAKRSTSITQMASTTPVNQPKQTTTTTSKPETDVKPARKALGGAIQW